MIAVISDLHAMSPKRLEQLSRDINRYSPDEIWCLGDLVGYGHYPQETVAWAIDNCQLTVSGNHDAAVAGLLPGFRYNLPKWLSQTLALAEDQLTSKQLDWLKNLPRRAEKYQTRLVHGSEPDPWMGFIDSVYDFEKTTGPGVALVGHSHCPGSRTLKAGNLKHLVAEHGDSIDINRSRLILNPGTAGLRQTDRNCQASDRRPGWMLYEPGAFAAWRRFGPAV